MTPELQIIDTHYDTVRRRLADDGTVNIDDRPALRRAVARTLAAEGVILQPDVWARVVRDIVTRLQRDLADDERPEPTSLERALCRLAIEQRDETLAEARRLEERVRALEAAVRRREAETAEAQEEADDALARARAAEGRVNTLTRDLHLSIDRIADAERRADRAALEGAELAGEQRREQAGRRSDIRAARARVRGKVGDAEAGSRRQTLEFGRLQGLTEALQILEG